MKLQKDLPRLLVICSESSVRSDIVTLLSGYGYYVDYESNINDGINRFKQTKHTIAILDAQALRNEHESLMQRFTVYKRNPIILVAAEKKDELDMIPFLKSGVYDILPLPLEVNRLDFVLKRLIDHSRLQYKHEFLKFFIVIAGLFIPHIILLAILLARG